MSEWRTNRKTHRHFKTDRHTIRIPNPKYTGEGETARVDYRHPQYINIYRLIEGVTPDTVYITGLEDAPIEEQVIPLLEHETIHKILAEKKMRKAWLRLDRPRVKVMSLSGADPEKAKAYLENVDQETER
jgi:hypothetical protein